MHSPKKPVYQVILELLSGIVPGAMALGGFIKLLPHGPDFINVYVAIAATLLVGISYIILLLLIKRRQFKWMIPSGQLVSVTKLNRKVLLLFTGGLAVLWICVIINTSYRQPSAPLVAIPAAIKDDQPVFTHADKRFKVLVLPWKQECTYQDKSYDIGYVLKERLNTMNERDRLGLCAYYLNYDSAGLANITPAVADSLMNYHHADYLLYGSYSFKECEGGATDMICFKYRTNPKDWWEKELNESASAEMHHIDGLQDLRAGAGREDIDNLLYNVAATSAIKQKQFKLAIAYLHKVKGFNNNEPILFQAATCYYFMKDYHNARLTTERALELDPSHDENRLHLGVMLLNEGNPAAAKDHLKQLLSRQPDRIEALRHLGIAYLQLKDTIAGDSCFRRILQTTPPTDANLPMMGTAAMDMRNYSEARKYYEKDLQHCPNHVSTMTQLVQVCQRLGDTAAAEHYVQQALAIDSTTSGVWEQLGIHYMNIKNFAQAQRCLQKAVAIDSTLVNAWNRLGLVHMHLGPSQTALSCFEKTLSLKPLDPVALYCAAHLCLGEKKYDNAVQYLQRLLDISPDNPDCWLMLGGVYERKGYYAKSADCFQRTLQLWPEKKNDIVYYNLAIVSSHQRNQPDVLRYLSKALTLNPQLKKKLQSDNGFNWLNKNKEFIALAE